MANKARLLFAITVYNGRQVVFPCLRSAASMAAENTDVDILVLDDASPEPGLSEEVEAACAELGLNYYRSPRNLGIPRNVNLGLLWALEKGYDYVVIANSDVLFCRGLPDLMVDAARPTPPSVPSPPGRTMSRSTPYPTKTRISTWAIRTRSTGSLHLCGAISVSPPSTSRPGSPSAS